MPSRSYMLIARTKPRTGAGRSSFSSTMRSHHAQPLDAIADEVAPRCGADARGRSSRDRGCRSSERFHRRAVLLPHVDEDGVVRIGSKQGGAVAAGGRLKECFDRLGKSGEGHGITSLLSVVEIYQSNKIKLNIQFE